MWQTCDLKHCFKASTAVIPIHFDQHLVGWDCSVVPCQLGFCSYWSNTDLTKSGMLSLVFQSCHHWSLKEISSQFCLLSMSNRYSCTKTHTGDAGVSSSEENTTLVINSGHVSRYKDSFQHISPLLCHEIFTHVDD